jgi:hypothetical protein
VFWNGKQTKMLEHDFLQTLTSTLKLFLSHGIERLHGTAPVVDFKLKLDEPGAFRDPQN